MVESRPVNTSMPNRFSVIIVVVALCATFYALGRPDVLTDNEGQRTAPPAEMLRTGNYVVPTINGVDYLVKPPLLYWAIAGLYKATGSVTPFVARIPTALCGALLVLAAYLLFRREAGEPAARWAALALLASPYALERMRWAELDIPLTLAVFLGVVAFRSASMHSDTKRVVLRTLAAGVAFGAAILLKGPVPVLFFWAAGIAVLTSNGTDPNRVVRLGLFWSVGAFALEVVAKTAAGLLPSHAKLLGAPVELTAVLVAWTVLAWRFGGATRGRTAGLWLASMLMGVALAAPWALAVLHSKGWPYIGGMLNNQVVERTYVASRINSGTPFYYLIALPAMLAPWGLLLPFQFSKGQWNTRPAIYRFGVVMGWLSVLVFSLIAGKEYEYILPCVPFLLLPTAIHLAEEPAGLSQRWIAGWLRVWRALLAVLLPFAALAGAIYLSVTEPGPEFLVLIWPPALIALLGGVMSLVAPRAKTLTVFTATLFVVLIGLIARDDAATRKASPRELATLCGDLVRAGYRVEAAKVYPAFAFYAATPIPIDIDPAKVRANLIAPAPYFYLVLQQDYVRSLLSTGDIPGAKIVAGPYGYKKDMVLVGNRDLPGAAEPE